MTHVTITRRRRGKGLRSRAAKARKAQLGVRRRESTGADT